MATIVLQAAGAFLGGLLGPIGGTIGAAAGAMAGYMLDRGVLSSLQHIEGPRLAGMRPFSAEEGAPIARVYGTMRIGGNIIWATRFEESSNTERQGGKGGPRVTTYSYYANAAFALCEGEIAGVRRIWADGREIDLEQMPIRIHRGTQTQPVDPLIAAKQGDGNAPAYRGLAYAVLERFPLGDYGNRIPQLQFEVMRPVNDWCGKVRSVVLLPGSTEYGLDPRPITHVPSPGETIHVNRNVLHGGSDLVASLDELQALCPNLAEVAIVAAWFGSDLRAGDCTIRPKVVHGDAVGYSQEWQVCGVTRTLAAEVSRVDDAASYGGTPTDASIVACIGELKSRGLRVSLYPFVMMDIPPDNALANPYGGASQPAFPWRGRITCNPAPGMAGTADKTGAARDQVEAFCGSVSPGDFVAGNGGVVYRGPAEDWGYRRLVLHYAHLAKAAGGVDGFLLGSEMRGLTTLRDGANAFPFVEALCQLAGEVRSIIGPAAEITYGADWSEYFGHQPSDGSGDVLFHLDPLWAHEAVTAVGIDNYMPISDWRDADYAGGNPDGFAQPYALDALRGQIAAGEGYDWYYVGTAARQGRVRSPITDGAYGKPWVYRYKDLRSWWENPHFNRIGGVEAGAPTAWVPRSKPIRFTELGCPAVDKGPNQPNAFPDARSSEHGMPHFSSGGRSDLAQAQFIRAHFEHWLPESASFDPADNPISPLYGDRMVPASHIHLWAWDARPFPAYPLRSDLWRDADNWQRGHWLNGRTAAVSTADLIAAVLADHGLSDVDVANIGGSLTGYLVDAPTTARATLEALVDLHGIAVSEEAGRLTFRDETVAADDPVKVEEMVVPEEGPTLERVRRPDRELPSAAELAFVDIFRDHQASVARRTRPGASGDSSQTHGLPASLESGAAEALLGDWLERRWASRETIAMQLPATAVAVSPGALVTLPATDGTAEYLVTDVEVGLGRRVAARRIVRTAPNPWRPGSIASRGTTPRIAGAPYALLLDLPAMAGTAMADGNLRLAAYAKPWKSQAAYASPEETGFAHTADATGPATLGEVVEASGLERSGRIDRHGALTVTLYSGSLSSVSDIQLLNGANVAAMRAANGVWEIVQYRDAEEIAPSAWRLTSLLRGQYGTEDATAAGTDAGAPFVLLDHAVVPVDLAADLTGIPINWRIGPAGQDFGDQTFVQFEQAAGLRGRMPLAPVHLRLTREADGDARLRWIRRGRIDADSWLAEDIPLGEEFERYRIEIRPAGGAPARTVETTAPEWTYTAAMIAADLPPLPAGIDVTVRQIGAGTGAGIAARASFTIA